MKPVALAWHQFRYDHREFWREPASVFFTVALPLIFLVLFTAIFGNQSIQVNGHSISFATYYIPGILTLSLVSATFVNLSVTVTLERERGGLKRLRTTPAPAWTIIASRTLTACAIALAMLVIVCGVGAIFYGVDLPTNTLPGALLALLVGVFSLTALGFAFTLAIPSANAAPPMTNAIVLPLYFISGIFVPQDQIPDWMDTIAGIFPIRPMFNALLTAFDPTTTGAGIEWGDLAVIAAWGVAGLAVALRGFRWMPRDG
jgi:ABC-2 type transport system permease protein